MKKLNDLLFFYDRYLLNSMFQRYSFLIDFKKNLNLKHKMSYVVFFLIDLFFHKIYYYKFLKYLLTNLYFYEKLNVKNLPYCVILCPAPRGLSAKLRGNNPPLNFLGAAPFGMYHLQGYLSPL